MPRFNDFDTRRYPVVDVRTGYGGWVATYEQSVEDVMDLALLDALATPDWPSYREAADLGCGTGRTAAWLTRHGVGAIDGVDLTPEMLDRARARGVFRSLTEAPATDTGLLAAAYDLVTTCLVDEHLPDLRPLYTEVARLARPGAPYVLVGYHPFFIMTTGMPTHYTTDSGESLTIETHLHLLSDHVTAALASGWTLAEMREAVIDDAWIARKPKWERHRGVPISFAFVWRKPA